MHMVSGPDVWDTLYCWGLPYIESILVDTLRKQSYGIKYDYSSPTGLYSHGERFFDWNFTGTECDYNTSLSLDRTGIFFMNGSYRGVTMSSDQGKPGPLSICLEPLQSLGNYYSIRLFTSVNGIIWIYNTSGTLYRSADMGISWSADNAGFGPILQLIHLTGHPGGTVFVLIDGKIHKSADG